MNVSLHPMRGATVIAGLVLLGFCGALRAQSQTRWLSLQPKAIYLETDVEAESDTDAEGQGSHFTTQRLYLAPMLGMDLAGSIYHPNLLNFSFKGQGGYIEQILTEKSAGESYTTRQTSYLQNYDLSGVLLQSKPYAATFMAAKTHTFQDVDPFNQVTVDSQSYGGRLGYSEGPVPITLTFKHMDVDETGLTYNNAYHQDDLGFGAYNNRASGSSSLSYSAGQYNQQTAGVSAENLTYQYATVQDTEKFWRDNRGLLNSSLYFNQESGATASTEANVQENLTIKHTPAWNSFCSYNFNDSTLESSDTVNHTGVIGVRNQLFQSLSSECDIHGSLQDASASGSSTSADIYGVGNAESYVKRLGNWGRLSIDNSVRYDIEQENNAGTVTPVLNEQHVLTDGVATYLTLPLVIAVTKVTDPTGTRNYINNIDYKVIPAGDLTQIERIPTSLNLTNNSTVLVSYTVQSQPSGSISTFYDQFQIRLDFFGGLVDVYTGFGEEDNHSREDFVLENNFTTQSGLDVNWRWLHAGATYETQQGNLLDYSAFGLYQSARFQPGPSSGITLDMRERWSHYSQEEEHSISDYTFTSRFTQRFDRSLDGALSLGAFKENGGPLAQTLFTAGARVKYGIGKLLLTLNYQFNEQQIVGGQNLRNFVSLTARRDF